MPPDSATRSVGRLRRLRAVGFVAALAIVSVAGPVGTAGAFAALPTVPVEGAGGIAAAATGGSFGQRAGFSPVYAAEVDGAQPAFGSVPVELTFTAPLSPAAYRSTEAYFVGAGLTITAPNPDRIALGVSGPAARVAAAFDTSLLSGTFQGNPALYPQEPPALPQALEQEVAGVVGLSAGFTAFSFALDPFASTGPASAPTPADGNEMNPALARYFYQLSSLYNLSGGHNGTTYPVGTSMAVVLWGAGYSPDDLSSFFSDGAYYWSSFPQPTITAYPVDGAPSPSASAPDAPDARAVEELTLDIEWAGSMAPGATIDAVYAPDGPAPNFSPSDTDLTAAFAEAIALNVSVISMSFGTTESTDGGLRSSWDTLFTDAQDKGITVLAATGDTGGDTQDDPVCSGTAAPEFPSSSPQVIAVGGTDVTVDRGLLGSVSFSESGWNSSGGGFSTQYAAPSWQEVGSAAGPIAANGHRGIPDVSATAADNFVYFNGSAGAAAGTSFATPLWAGLIASIDAKWGQRLGFVTPRLYHIGAVEPSGAVGDGLVDVTGGANCVGTAGTGWDDVTGWGSPRANLLYEDLLGSFVNLTVTVDRTTVAPGGSVTVSAQLTNRSTSAPLVRIPVSLTLAADTSVGPCTGTFGSASPTTNATGWVQATFSVPLCYLGQHALANASVMTTTLYGQEGVRLNVNLLGFVPALAILEQSPWVYVTYSVIVGAAAVVGVWLGGGTGRARRAGGAPPAGPRPTPSPPVASPPPSPPTPPPPSVPVAPRPSPAGAPPPPPATEPIPPPPGPA